MDRYSSANNLNSMKTSSMLYTPNSNHHSRERTFDPLNYEFDAETMVEPFTYFHNGPTESRRKTNEYPSPTLTHFTWLSAHTNSILSSPDASPQSNYSPNMHDQIHLKSQQTTPQKQRSQVTSYPKTICRHCKSHNMPECLYTSHTMYDESGALFCPVLKKCHCASCIRVINTNHIRDDDSDDDIHIHLPSTTSMDSNVFYGNYPRDNSYRLMNNNNNV